MTLTPRASGIGKSGDLTPCVIVESQLRPEVDFPDVLRALFPSGSITGAPKIQTMKLIRELENTPRGLYTGSIGWIDPAPADRGASETRCPNFCLSVAIRTLVLGAQADGTRAAVFGVGGGIVIDSDAASELEETRAKGRFLIDLDPGFSLIETMKAVGGRVPLLDRHLARLAGSCRALGFRTNPERITEAIFAQLDRLAAGKPYRLRLSVSCDGGISLSAIEHVPAGPVVAVVLASSRLTDEEASLSRFKTSYRPTYAAELARATERNAFDALFADENGFLTEGARTSVFVRQRGRWYTPRLRAGVLPGVMRAVLLEDSALRAVEADIPSSALLEADELLICNAVHGALKARLLHEGPPGGNE